MSPGYRSRSLKDQPLSADRVTVLAMRAVSLEMKASSKRSRRNSS